MPAVPAPPPAPLFKTPGDSANGRARNMLGTNGPTQRSGGPGLQGDLGLINRLVLDEREPCDQPHALPRRGIRRRKRAP